MKKYLLPIMFLAFWSCEDPKDENEPTPVSISHFQDSLDNDVIQWSMNNDIDFFRYILYGSNDKSMANKKIIYETQTRTDTNYVLESDEFYNSYRVDVLNLNESFSSSNVLNNVFVELWGEYYSIEYTTYLNLSNNQLTGEIPSEIGNLTNLYYLDLRNNQLSGEIPTEIENLTNLNELDLRNNQLSGIIPDNNFVCQLGFSEGFLFSNNQFCPPYPSCIQYYVGYQNLSSCEGVIELWGDYYSIEYTTSLSLRFNDLTGEIPSEIENLTNLEYLSLSDNQLSGEIPDEICNLTNLRYLYLYNNQLTGEIPDEICNMTNLAYANFSHNQLCPPYPTCVEQIVGEQDTSNCD